MTGGAKIPTVQRMKMPDRCPVHPESGAVVSKTTGDEDDSVRAQHRITQHLCAEPDCQQPLGWEYRGPGGNSSGCRHVPARNWSCS